MIIGCTGTDTTGSSWTAGSAWIPQGFTARTGEVTTEEVLEETTPVLETASPPPDREFASISEVVSTRLLTILPGLYCCTNESTDLRGASKLCFPEFWDLRFTTAGREGVGRSTVPEVGGITRVLALNRFVSLLGSESTAKSK